MTGSSHSRFFRKLVLKKTLFLFILFGILTAGAEKAGARENTYDFLIRGAVVYDGISTRERRVDVAIDGDRIAAIGDLKKTKARQTIDAKGWILAPGFIDAHTHSDFNPLVYPEMTHKLMQGVTTEIAGNCGMSAAPVLGPHAEKIKSVWAREGVQIADTVSWRTLKEYRKRLESQGMFVNMAGLAGHGNIRSAVMGFTPRPATQSEIEAMKKILKQSMKDGAVGISFGLIYLPGIFAGEEELVALCREAARHSGVCAFHVRSESAQLLEAIEEALRIGEKAEAPVQISHLKASGKSNFEKIDQAFRLIETARLKGMRVAADFYPYTAGFAELGVILPDEVFEKEDRAELFRDLSRREELLLKLRAYYEEKSMKWDGIVIASSAHKKYRQYEGKSIRDIARQTGKEPEAFLIEILADTRFETSAYFFSQDEKVIEKVAKKMYTAVGSDSIADGSRRPHPRVFGTFPKVLREYVREKRILSLGEALRKMTSLPARQFRLEGRGEIRAGFFADLVLFDAGEISDLATYDKPDLPSWGMKWVFVNGRPVVQSGKPVLEKAGRFLSRSR